MAAQVPLGIKTHVQKICSVYKQTLRNLEAFYDRRNVYRYHAVQMRVRFDEIVNEKDFRKSQEMLKLAQEELFLTQHPIPKKFPLSPGGVAYERIVNPPDWVLDYWHPLEKAQYPEYFKKREQRKKEFIAMWEKEYGKYDPKIEHH
ncbi:NADH dehydrogenase [ubiquinone] 1 beta subcomplex subunit 9 [Ostrinia furnacalis]|uniref:NADH dehydrogenase [ubiquinone] 1 beta subcomplex subunit 9 n=1 Tax=Ostrinia furnacalis TaxID=93504 RepID=UPI00103E472E|nr:NADH dehydrogenase [ubiquinone] 1 beta subcomplex subunit 9 [Ostrinia furnacalis]